MKATLESFIDPKNIPQKYGGQLEFQFGDMPVLDPHLENVLKWEGDNKDFPHGPMFWIDKTKDGKEIKALAVGSVNGTERREGVCTVTKALKDDEDLKGANGSASAIRPELLRAPTAAPSEAEEPEKPRKVIEEELKAEDVPVVVQEGELVPATRPEPVSFVTASQDIETLSLNEKSGNLERSNAPHVTHTANLLDPNLKLDGAADSEDGHKHHEASDKSNPAVGGGVQEADSAHANGSKGSNGNGVLGKVGL